MTLFFNNKFSITKLLRVNLVKRSQKAVGELTTAVVKLQTINEDIKIDTYNKNVKIAKIEDKIAANKSVEGDNRVIINQLETILGL